MKSTLTIEHDTRSITSMVKCQGTGKVAIGPMLDALSIPRSKWNTTVLQITIAEIKTEEPCEE